MNTLTRFCLALSLVLAGCFSADNKNSTTGTTIIRHKVCKNSQCDSLKAQGKDLCSDCIDTCTAGAELGSSTDCWQMCESACTPDHCDNDTCEAYSYTFEVVGEYDPRVFDACQRTVAHFHQQCGTTVSPHYCDLAARIYVPQAAAWYDCVAAESCSSSASHCYPPLATIGEEWNSAVAKVCPNLVFDSATVQSFDRFASVLRADVKAAARDCANEPGCDAKAQCMNAWFEAVAPSE